MITILVAFDEDLNIGKNNSIPWHFPEDLINFKNLTTNNVCIMGRNTWESLPDKFRPLPNRKNIVVSTNYYNDPDKFMGSFGRMSEDFDAFAVRDLDEAILAYENMFLDKECFIIGGGKVYKETLEKNFIDRMIITHINGNYNGDVKFPEINKDDWIITQLSKNENFKIIQYDKKIIVSSLNNIL